MTRFHLTALRDLDLIAEMPGVTEFVTFHLHAGDSVANVRLIVRVTPEARVHVFQVPVPEKCGEETTYGQYLRIKRTEE